MKHDPPAPPVISDHNGISYALFVPDGVPKGGMVVLHGAGSAKESHFDFARTCRARGVAALCFDARGHGRSTGEFGPSAVGDVLAMRDVLAEHVSAIGLRGSSLGGFLAIQAAAAEPSIAAVVAICPAPPELLARMLDTEAKQEFRVDRESTVAWLRTLDPVAGAAALGPGTALLLLHAEGDERVPFAASQELYDAAAEPKRLVIFPGGHHRSLQHDVEVQNMSARFAERAFDRR